MLNLLAQQSGIAPQKTQGMTTVPSNFPALLVSLFRRVFWSLMARTAMRW
jgi:hypothetical protein